MRSRLMILMSALTFVAGAGCTCKQAVEPSISVAEAESEGEDRVERSDGVTGGAIAGVVWTRDANLSVGGAIAGVSRIEDKFGLAPIPLVNWRFGQGWFLRSGVPDFGARRGFGLELG